MATAIILGGGIAGLTAGTALARAGWRFRIYERTPRFDAVGAALSLWPNAIDGLHRLGLAERILPLGAPIAAMMVADRRQRPILRRGVDGPAIVITRARLQAALAEALPADALVPGRRATGIAQDAACVRVSFDDGSTDVADLLVDAAGLRSVVATASGLSYRGYGGVVAVSDPVAGDGLDGVAAEYWGRGERFGLFELPDDRRYWFHMRTQGADAKAPARDAILARSAGWAPAIARAIAATPADRLIPVAIHARPAPKSLGERRVIRVGDAAHAMEPNLGQGGCQAIEDAVALQAVAQDRDPARMLTAFERLRLARVAMIVRRAAEGRYGAHGSLAAQWATRTALRLMPSGVADRIARSIQMLPG